MWYLASHLSGLLRQRDAALAKTNLRLEALQEERARHMLSTTHQLKSPFAAIHANTQVLLRGHCGELPQRALDVVGRIAARSRRLTTEIQEMLQLANLGSRNQDAPARVRLDVSEVLASCVGQIEPTARARMITFDVETEKAYTMGVEEHLKMMFANLISNAAVYSHEGGTVRVRCGPRPQSGPVVTISDDGIGIPAEKLPLIFNEHYRTKEAVQHNKESSGLGLSIVRHVAQLNRIALWVASGPGAGTTFELRFPQA